MWKKSKRARRSGSRPVHELNFAAFPHWFCAQVKANSVFMEDEFQKLGAVVKKGDPWTAHVCKSVTHRTFNERYGYVTGHLITAQNPQSADACAAAVIEALA